MTTKTDTDWEALGREAVRLGMPTFEGMATMGAGGYRTRGEAGWEDWQKQPGLPDFRDELTALACLPWAEKELEHCGPVWLSRTPSGGFVWECTTEFFLPDAIGRREFASRPEACIAAAKAVRGEP